MDRGSQKLKARRFSRWIIGKNKRANAYRKEVLSDGDDDHYMDNIFVTPLKEIDPCMLINDLRIFVGTWNVAGRSPVGRLAVDLDEWLNLKDGADIYVLGFQEIVPLKTINVIGAEDPTEATNWNLLIGKTLNEKYGCPWLTPMLNPISSEQYVRIPASERRISFGHASYGFPMGERCRSLQDNTFEGSKYKLMASKKMVGVFISVWMKKELLQKCTVSDVKVCSVACGIMGYLGNKGSVSVSMSIEGTSFCFVASHLASGEKKGDESRRNHQVSEIFRRTSFPRSSKDDNGTHPLTILGHDRIFWFGDLNYRLYLEDSLARYLIRQENWKGLQEFDQLRRELETGGVFQGWKEGNIEFAPTYKYSSTNCNCYSGGLPGRSGEKQRTPAWCDRILWYGKGVKQLSYVRSESKFSDHRPVSALFYLPIEVVKDSKPRTSAVQTTLSNIKSTENKELSNSTETGNSSLQSLLRKDEEASSTRTAKL